MGDPLTTFSTRRAPQNRQADPAQKLNSAGGYAFEISDLERLRRFLTLGTEGGTYYTGAVELTASNAQTVLRMAAEDGLTLVDTIKDISQRGAAPKPNPALFALAIAASSTDVETRKYALEALPAVARTGTHLFTFAAYTEQFRGWGRSLRNAVADWYTSKPSDRLGYQVAKYRQRNGWTHRDLLRLSHPETSDESQRAVFEWLTRGTADDDLPDIITGYLEAQSTEADIPGLIKRYSLSWEMLPTEVLNRASSWEALLEVGIPTTALMRQLPRLTRLNLFSDPAIRRQVTDQLTSSEALKRARVHPINVLVAQRTYAAGASDRGSSTWTPNRHITDALDDAFYRSFDAVEPSGKRTLLALDVSGSMSFQGIAGMPLSPREASAALALVQMSTEPETETIAFTGGRSRPISRGSWGFMLGGAEAAVEPLNISPRQRLDDAVRAVSHLPFGPTDCSLPMSYALENDLEVDTFVIYTDSETWAGRNHPHLALREYRQKTGIDAKLIVVGMTANDVSIADPNDSGMLDIAGFDAAVPQLITDFSRGL